MSNFTDETYVPSRITYRPGGDPGAIGAGKIWVDASVEPPTVKVRNKANDGWDAIGGGGAGGAVTVNRYTFDLTALEAHTVSPIAITGGSGSTATVIVAGDHTDIFPVGGQASLVAADNSGDGYLFGIQSSTFDGTHTTIVFGQTFLPDDLTGLFVTPYGQTPGAEFYTPSNPGNEYVLAILVDVTAEVNGTGTQLGTHVGVYSVADRFIQNSTAFPVAVDDAVGISDAVQLSAFGNTGMLIFGNGTPPTKLNADGIILVIDDGNGGLPALTSGTLTVTVVILTATDI